MAYASQPLVGLVGWRGMVGSVLMDRMQAEGDFGLIEPVFFSTSNTGGTAPAMGRPSGPLRDANDRLQGRKQRSTLTRLLVIALLGAILAVVLSEDLRKTVLDKLFGSEEEFEYSSTTAPSPAPPRTRAARTCRCGSPRRRWVRPRPP